MRMQPPNPPPLGEGDREAVEGVAHAGQRASTPSGPLGHLPQRGRILAGQVTYPWTTSTCGSLRTTLAETEVMLRPSGAVWIEAERTLIVADLHLEKGSAYAARGQMLPPYDTRDTLNRLADEVTKLTPQTLVLLGDTFHDGASEDRLAADDVERLRTLATGRTLIWVVGNHDADGPRDLPGEVADELTLAGLILRHEPLPGLQLGEVAGHLHPCARVASAKGSVRRRCFATDGSRMVIPAFGAYAGGLSVRDAAFSGLFARPPLIGALGTDRVHAVGWRSIIGV